MTGWSREWVAQKYGSSGFSVGNSVPADRRVTPPTELTGGPRRVCPRQAAPAVLPSRTRSGGSRSRVGPDDGSPSQQGFTPRRGERSSGALDREGTGCRQLGAGRLGQRAVGASLRPWSDPGQVTHGEPGSAQSCDDVRAACAATRLRLRGPGAGQYEPGVSDGIEQPVPYIGVSMPEDDCHHTVDAYDLPRL